MTPPNDTPAPAAPVDLREALARAARSAVNLRVITLVGDTSPTGSLDSPRVDLPAAQAAVVTNINLLGGDIVTCVSPAMVNGDLAELRAFHDGMVAKAEGIVERNVRLLRELIDAGFDRLGGGAG